METLKNIDKVAWLYIQERKLLVTKEFNKDAFFVPGGKREGEESDIECLVRELKEELNIDLKAETALFVGKFEAQAYDKPEGVMVVMQCYSANYAGELTPTSEIEAFGWLTSADIGATTPVMNLILRHLQEKNLID